MTITETPTLAERGTIDGLEAFNALIEQHQHTAFSVAYRYLGSRSAAEDAVQEAFLRAYAARARFRGDHARAWLLRIVANVARDELRRRRRRPQTSLEADRDGIPLTNRLRDPSRGPEAEVLQAELRASLEGALAQLPEDWRLAVLLADVHGLPYQEVAEISGVRIGTIKSRITRARRRLRDLLTPAGELKSPEVGHPLARSDRSSVAHRDLARCPRESRSRVGA